MADFERLWVATRVHYWIPRLLFHKWCSR